MTAFPVLTRRGQTPRQLRTFRRLSGSCLILALSLQWIPDASAQFNARGRGRSPATSSPSSTSGSPRPSSSPKTAPSSSNSSATTGSAPGAAAPTNTRSSEDRHNDVLIARYRGLIVSQPGEEVPLRRLAELIRKRDGNLNQLLQELKQQAETAETNRYGALVAYAGLLIENRESEKALTPLEQATQLAQDQAPAWLMLARVQEGLEQKEQARTSYEKALSLVSGADELFLLRTLRSLALDLKDYTRAAELHDKLVRRSRDSSFVQGELGRELLKRGENARALDELRRVEKASRGDYRAQLPALVDLGQALLAAEQLDEAIVTLEKAAGLAKSQPGQLYAIELLLADAHQAAGSLSEYCKQLEGRANSAQSQALLGRLYEQEGHTEQAISAYRHALRLDRKDIDTELRLVRLLELTGDLEGALASYRALTRAAPTDVDLAIRYMNMLLAQGERRGAIAEWDRIERATAQDVDAGLLLVDFAERLEETERARKLLTRLSESQRGDARFVVEVGSRYFKRGDAEKARQIWGRIPEVHHSKSAGQVLLGEVLIDHDAVPDGLSAIEKGVALDPNNPSHLKALALAQERAASQSQERVRSRYEQQAIESYQRLLTLPGADNEKIFARRHLVRLWQRRSELRREVTRLQALVERDPPDLDAARLLAEAYQREGDTARAIAMLELVLAKSKGDRQTLLQLVAAYEKKQDYAATIDILKRLIEADPPHSREYYERMARAARASGRADDALHFAELGVQRSSQDPAALAKLAELYLSQGQLKKAEDALRSALSKDDALDHANLLLADILSQTKRPNDAFERLLVVLRRSSDPQLIGLAGRRMLGLAGVIGKTASLEDVLRRMSISRPEQAIYRTLLLETMSAELYPLQLKEQFGSTTEQSQARAELAELARRNLGPLLAALAGEHTAEQKLALLLLAYDDSAATQSALLAIAEESGPVALRLQAVLAIQAGKNPAVIDQLMRLIVDGGRARRDPLALAGTWVLARANSALARSQLFSLTDVRSPEVEGIALLGLAEQSELSPTQHTRLLHVVEDLLQESAASPLLRGAATLAWGSLQATALHGSSEHTLSRLLANAESAEQRKFTLFALGRAFAAHPTQRPASAARYLAEGLLDPNDEIVRAAMRACVASERDYPRLLPQELSVETLSLSAQLSLILERWASAELPAQASQLAFEQLRAPLRTLAQSRLHSDRDSAARILQALAPGQLLAPLRAELKAQLLPLAEPTSPLQSEAIGLLRATDSAEAAGLLRRSLEQTATMEAAMSALENEASAAALHALESFEKRTEPASSDALPWYTKRRLAQAYRQIYIAATHRPAAAGAATPTSRPESDAYATDSVEDMDQVRAQAQSALARLQSDPNPLVQRAALLPEHQVP